MDTLYSAGNWSFVVVDACIRVEGYVQVRCVWSRDYHTVNGIYIVRKPTDFEFPAH
jgi:hypothetical protein